jgi:hypothetical protein
MAQTNIPGSIAHSLERIAASLESLDRNLIKLRQFNLKDSRDFEEQEQDQDYIDLEEGKK